MHESETTNQPQDPGSFGSWLASNPDVVERIKNLSEQELTKLIQFHFRVIDEVGPPYALSRRSLAMRELLRLGA